MMQAHRTAFKSIISRECSVHGITEAAGMQGNHQQVNQRGCVFIHIISPLVRLEALSTLLQLAISCAATCTLLRRLVLL